MTAIRTSNGRACTTPPRTFLIHLTMIGIGVVMFYPLTWMLSASVRPDSRINDPGIWPAGDLTIDGYTTGFAGISGVVFWQYIGNSLLVSTLSVAANLIACSLTAYAFARMDFPLRRLWFAVMLATLMLPHHVLLIPQYIEFRTLGWTNTYLPFVVPKILATDAFFVFLLVQFFRTIPRDLDEAARLDGCGHFRIFTRIILPLSKPALATAAIFSFIYSWNDFFTPLLYLTDTRLFTVPLALRAFIDTTAGSAFGALFAMSVVSLLPVLGVFIAFQKLLVEGISTTGLKG